MTIQEKLQLFHNNPVTSWHEHVWFKAGTQELDVAHLETGIRYQDALGIDRIVVSNPITSNRHCPPADFITANNIVAEAVKR